MKKIVIQPLLLIVCSICTGQEYIRLSDGATVTGTEYETIPTRTIENVDNGILVTYRFYYASKLQDKLFPSSYVLLFDGLGLNSTSEEPAIPLRWDTFAIPSISDYSISIVNSSYIDIPLEMAPARYPLQNNIDEVYTPDNVLAIRSYQGFYPQNILESTTRVYQNHPLLDVCIKPIQYHYQNKAIRLFREISYLIDFANSSSTNRASMISAIEDNLFIANIAQNPYSGNITNRAGISATQLNTPRYLIITVPKYNEAVVKLADWKRTQGYEVNILSQTTWSTSAVESAIASENQTVPLSYLLIVGDFEDVPGKNISRKINTTTYNFYSDYYYGFINQNDSMPSIHRGRIPVSTAAEAMAVINKTICYEKTPSTDASYYQTCLNCAYFQDDEYRNSQNIVITPIDSCEDRRFVLTAEEVRNHLLTQGKTVKRAYYAYSNRNPYYWNVGQYGFNTKVPIPVELRRESGFLWNGDSTEILNSINSGSFIVYHRDHGAKERWGKPQFGLHSIDLLNNGKKLPVVFSMNCLTGRYSEGTCFAEALLRKENGGCAAIIAATETSFSGYNDALTLAMTSAIWPEPLFIKKFPNYGSSVTVSDTPIYRIGDILDIGFEYIKEIFPNRTEKVYLHTKEIFHCFGDPSMELYTDLPTPFDEALVSNDETNILVQTGEEAIVTFYNLTTGTVQSFYGSNVMYPTADNIRICISAHNKIPYIAEYSNGILYIQDEGISTNRTYIGSHIKVGSNVTSSRPYGKVLIEGGKTTMRGNTVELHSETTVLKGAEIEINN